MNLIIQYGLLGLVLGLGLGLGFILYCRIWRPWHYRTCAHSRKHVTSNSTKQEFSYAFDITKASKSMCTITTQYTNRNVYNACIMHIYICLQTNYILLVNILLPCGNVHINVIDLTKSNRPCITSYCAGSSR